MAQTINRQFLELLLVKDLVKDLLVAHARSLEAMTVHGRKSHSELRLEVEEVCRLLLLEQMVWVVQSYWTTFLLFKVRFRTQTSCSDYFLLDSSTKLDHLGCFSYGDLDVQMLLCTYCLCFFVNETQLSAKLINRINLVFPNLKDLVLFLLITNDLSQSKHVDSGHLIIDDDIDGKLRHILNDDSSFLDSSIIFNNQTQTWGSHPRSCQATRDIELRLIRIFSAGQ